MPDNRPPLHLTPAQQADFMERHLAWEKWRDQNPGATLREMAAFKQTIRPKDPEEAKLFARYQLELMKQDVRGTRNKTLDDRGLDR